MKPTIFLRIASILTLIHSIMHTIGGVFGKPSPGTAAMVAATMQGNSFPVFGVIRSYGQFYFGMGMGLSISLTVEAVLLWQLGELAKKDAARLRPILAIQMLGFAAFAINSFLYFFAGPVVVEVLIALCLGLAIATAKTIPAISGAALIAHS